jgi:bla regulator protein blaR1
MVVVLPNRADLFVTQASPQTMSQSEHASHSVHVAPEVLDRYAGTYRVSQTSVFTVSRNGEQLTTIMTGQGPVDHHAESETQFYSPRVQGRIHFSVDPDGRAVSMTLEQHGHRYEMPRITAEVAQEIEAKAAEKIRSQTPTAGTETALRHLIDGLAAGQPDYAQMGQPLIDATREQLPQLKASLDAMGELESLQFIGVGSQGWDVYHARFERGSSIWRLVLSDEGLIQGALVAAGP